MNTEPMQPVRTEPMPAHESPAFAAPAPAPKPRPKANVMILPVWIPVATPVRK